MHWTALDILSVLSTVESFLSVYVTCRDKDERGKIGRCGGKITDHPGTYFRDLE